MSSKSSTVDLSNPSVATLYHNYNKVQYLSVPEPAHPGYPGYGKPAVAVDKAGQHSPVFHTYGKPKGPEGINGTEGPGLVNYGHTAPADVKLNMSATPPGMGFMYGYRHPAATMESHLGLEQQRQLAYQYYRHMAPMDFAINMDGHHSFRVPTYVSAGLRA